MNIKFTLLSWSTWLIYIFFYFNVAKLWFSTFLKKNFSIYDNSIVMSENTYLYLMNIFQSNIKYRIGNKSSQIQSKKVKIQTNDTKSNTLNLSLWINNLTSQTFNTYSLPSKHIERQTTTQKKIQLYSVFWIYNKLKQKDVDKNLLNGSI